MNYMTTTTPPTPAERLADWAQKAWLSGYDFVTGPRASLSEYERAEMLDGQMPTTDSDYFEEIGYEH